MDNETKIAVGNMSIATAGATLYGLTLNEWVAVLTIAYLILQITLLIPKYYSCFLKLLRGKKRD